MEQEKDGTSSTSNMEGLVLNDDVGAAPDHSAVSPTFEVAASNQDDEVREVVVVATC